ncbi:uncharacterized protein LOC129762640 [Toxorhynchites rutilus septentrionalis]|uniref:uncharacterized protein LOC129762640 n=1 Tax=Toxorhynchites rutilus septentrionalis TaxID=329112 RepID=UPI0024783D2C|nr:uncharacterized protein LOC129762640 [Toxorhynchites rutilus septentrionalis]
MSVEELVIHQNTGQQCRLCLHWIDAALCAERMVDIFTFNEGLNASLADKIRDCLGLYIDPADTVSNICSNCVHTISFIDDFRILCHQTQEIYDSTQFRFNNVIQWQCYNNHVSELRALLHGQREWLDNNLNDARIVDSAIICNELEDIASPEFIKVKEEQDENEPECDQSLLGIKSGVNTSEPVSESIEDSNNIKSPIIEDRFTKFQLKLKMAHELQAQKRDKPDLRAVAKKMNLEFHKIKQLWKEMVVFYRISKKRAHAGHEAYISRCRRCPLFTTLNVIIPKYEHQKPYEESKINTAKNNDKTNALVRRKASIDLDLIIAEEIKAHPELWDLSLNCTAHGMKIVWKTVTRKLSMNMRTLRNHWRRLRDAYRAHKLRELKGTLKQEPANEKYEYLISILQQIVGPTMSFEVPVSASAEQNEQTDMSVSDDEDVIMEEYDDGYFYNEEQQLALVQEVQKYPIIWCYKHPDFLDAEKRDLTFDKIAENLSIDRETVKQEWARLKNTFHNRYLRLLKGQLQSDDALIVEPLYQVLNEMLGESIGIRKNEEEDPDRKFDNETKLEFAKICYDNDILWNMKHPDYNAQDKRNAVWILIAAQFGVTQEKIKNEWCCLRNMYRNRYLRAQSSSSRKRKSGSSKTPLHHLMKSMFEEQMLSLYAQEEHVRAPSGHKKGTKSTKLDNVEKKPFGTPEDRMKLLEEISTHDILWNVNNPQYKKKALHVPVFEEIAAKFHQTPSIIKEEWQKLRRVYRHRKRQAALDREDSNTDDMDPLHALLEKLLSPKPIETVDYASQSEEEAYPKRRYVGKRSFSDDGCIKLEVNGIVRYAKVCELCGKQVERSRFEYHMNAHYGHTPYACSFEGCDKKYSDKSIRDKHEVAIHGEDGYIFQCDQCDRKFKQKAKYECHYAVKHKSQELPCGICGKLLPHKHILKKHMRIHAQSYECHVCGKVLQKKYTLKIHMRVHTKEKPYQCELCEQRFMLKVQLKTHLLKVHGVVLEELQAATMANKS